MRASSKMGGVSTTTKSYIPRSISRTLTTTLAPTRSAAEGTNGAGSTRRPESCRNNMPSSRGSVRSSMTSATSTIVRVGKVLTIPSSDGWEGASPYWVVYEVAAGDTLSAIAATYDLNSATLRAVNDLVSADLLVVGQPLVLPLDTPAEVVARVLTPTSAPLPAPTPEAATPVAIPTSLPPTPAPLPADVAAWPSEVWRIMNAVRAEHGLPPYTYNDALSQAAQLHAEDCQQRQSCGHTGSDGSTIKVRILRAGYDPASWSECWAVRPSPQSVIDIWMDEVPPDDAHRRTLLHTWFTEVGIGVAASPWEGYYYVIADFGRPK